MIVVTLVALAVTVPGTWWMFSDVGGKAAPWPKHWYSF